MDEYLISYEYKVSNGCLVSIKVATRVFNAIELRDFTEHNGLYDNYMKVIFCEKL